MSLIEGQRVLDLRLALLLPTVTDVYYRLSCLVYRCISPLLVSRTKLDLLSSSTPDRKLYKLMMSVVYLLFYLYALILYFSLSSARFYS